MPAAKLIQLCGNCALPLGAQISHCPYCGRSRRPSAGRQIIASVLQRPLLVPLIALVLIAGLAEWALIVKLYGA